MPQPEQGKRAPRASRLDDHEDDDSDTTGDYGDPLWEQPRVPHAARFVPRIGVTGPTRDLTHGFFTTLIRWLIATGRSPLVVTFDTHDWGEATRLRFALTDVLDAACIVSVITGHQPDRALPAAVASELITRFPGADTLLCAGYAGTAPVARDTTFVHYVIDIADGTSTLLDPPHAPDSADLCVIHEATGKALRAETRMLRPSLPIVIADCISGQGLEIAFGVLWDDLFS